MSTTVRFTPSVCNALQTRTVQTRSEEHGARGVGGRVRPFEACSPYARTKCSRAKAARSRKGSNAFDDRKPRERFAAIRWTGGESMGPAEATSPPEPARPSRGRELGAREVAGRPVPRRVLDELRVD